MPPEEMINKCSKRKFFFDHNRRLIRSKHSRVAKGSREGSDPIRNAIFSEDDDDFIDFVEVSSVQVPYITIIAFFLYIFVEMPNNRPVVKVDARAGFEAQLDQEKSRLVHIQAESNQGW